MVFSKTFIGANMNWFWDCLVDADLANNSTSWQWVAGSGVDAAPYFRIFNPIAQGEKFDSNGGYTKRFVLELKNMPNKYLFKPWATPANVLKSAGVVLGVTYPMPIVDFTVSRKNALKRYKYL
jgi:deoxyribodipyrimidine photo-lyase